MPEAAPPSDKLTIVSMAIVAESISAVLHEGVGHGVVCWLRGGTVLELTSNHLTSQDGDKWVPAGGTLVNLAVGAVCLLVANSGALRERANARYFLWLLAALNLLPGAGYFLFSGVTGFGDWNRVLEGLPNVGVLRVVMTLFGAGLYYLVVWRLARAVKPFVPEPRAYNAIGRLPYIAAALFYCAAGALDPLGLPLLFMSTMPAVFGGHSGLLWADKAMGKDAPTQRLAVQRAPAWWVVAAVVGVAFIAVLGPGIRFA